MWKFVDKYTLHNQDGDFMFVTASTFEKSIGIFKIQYHQYFGNLIGGYYENEGLIIFDIPPNQIQYQTLNGLYLKLEFIEYLNRNKL